MAAKVCTRRQQPTSGSLFSLRITARVIGYCCSSSLLGPSLVHAGSCRAKNYPILNRGFFAKASQKRMATKRKRGAHLCTRHMGRGCLKSLTHAGALALNTERNHIHFPSSFHNHMHCMMQLSFTEINGCSRQLAFSLPVNCTCTIVKAGNNALCFQCEQ
eukprot:408777-Pelagomonas_calceolata.AAC.1